MSKANEGKPGFEESLSVLERIVRQLESGDLPLERALELFEEGVVLARQCQSQLEDAERKVELLLRERGEIKTIPFEPANFESGPDHPNNKEKENKVADKFDKNSSGVGSNPVAGRTAEALSRDEEQEEKLNDAIPF